MSNANDVAGCVVPVYGMILALIVVIINFGRGRKRV